MTTSSWNFTVILVTLLANQIEHRLRNLSKSQKCLFLLEALYQIIGELLENEFDL